MGNPIKIELSAGQVSDHILAPKLLADLKPQIVMADGGYDSAKFRLQIEKQGAIACIPRHRNRKIKFPFDKEQYKERHLVECFFQKLNVIAESPLVLINFLAVISLLFTSLVFLSG